MTVYSLLSRQFMPGWQLPFFSGNGFSSSDVALLKEVESLMPPGPLSPQSLVRNPAYPNEDVDVFAELQRCSEALSASAADPAARRAATAVMDEIRRYFNRQDVCGSPNARTVLAGHLVRFAADLLLRETAKEALRWWTEFLLRVEDARPFTKSNWAHSSTFEETLGRCRLVLLDLSKEETSHMPLFRQLRETLREAHNLGRHAADSLMELLYIALRQSPTERFAFLELSQQVEAGSSASSFTMVEDEIIYHILHIEKCHVADLLADCFLQQLQGATEHPQEDLSDQLDHAGHTRESLAARARVQQLLRILHEHLLDPARSPGGNTGLLPSTVHSLGDETWLAFVELHGLYCLLAALLHRAAICLEAIQDYAKFMCFLPVHQASLLDLEQLFPQLRAHIVQKTQQIMDAYERLPRHTAPPGRFAVLTKGRGLLQKLEQTAASCQSAKEALRAVTPQATLKDFHRWRATDLRWRQFARLHLAARALFSPEQLQALEVGTVADSLMRGVPQFALEGPAANPPERLPEPTEPRYEGGLARFVDEDTRLHQAACGLALLGETAWKRAWVAASLVNDTAKHLLPQDTVSDIAPLGYAKVSRLVEAFIQATGVGASKLVPRTVSGTSSMDWIVLDDHGQAIETWTVQDSLPEE